MFGIGSKSADFGTSGVSFPVEAVRFLHGRAITPAVATAAGVRVDHGALVFPYRDRSGRPLFERRRPLDGIARQPRGHSLRVWGLETLGRARVCFLCEGETDRLALMSAWPGAPHPILAVPGASAFRAAAGDLADMALVYAIPDADAAGERFMERLDGLMPGRAVRVFLPACGDLAGLLSVAPEALGSLVDAYRDARATYAQDLGGSEPEVWDGSPGCHRPPTP